MKQDKRAKEIQKRRTFAIISHPDAGKTTITEKLLHLGKIINKTGSIKAKKTGNYTKSDWLKIEQERGISVTSTAVQFPFEDKTINLVDTPGHGDFSEDTYRTLTAVDSALMVIDGAKGVEERTIELMKVTRLRNTPIITFVNKCDRNIKNPIDLLDEIEATLKISCIPLNWPIGSGDRFFGVYNFLDKKITCYKKNQDTQQVDFSLDFLKHHLDEDIVVDFVNEKELIEGTIDDFAKNEFLKGQITPVFFGSALAGFGVDKILNAFALYAPEPKFQPTTTKEISATSDEFSGFIFKIQANMDPKHHDRMAFMRICSGFYEKGNKLLNTRSQKKIILNDAKTFLANQRENASVAYPGDIIGIQTHGNIQIGDTFTSGKQLQFTGIPNFAPLLFKNIRLKDPMKNKQLQKGLTQLAEEGAMQVFRPISNNDLIVGAIGVLQFDLVVNRLKNEYKVDAIYEIKAINTIRWIKTKTQKDLEKFIQKNELNIAKDAYLRDVFIAKSPVNLRLAKENNPDIEFLETI